MLRALLVVGMVAAAPAVASAQDVEAGKAVFKKCAACHQLGKNAAGPNLVGIVGRKSGSVEGYTYSEANKSSHLTWDEPTLDKYLSDAANKTLPGTKMIFPGVKDETDRKNLIAYLATLK